MVKRYAHVTARLRRDIADRLNTYLWAGNETTNETEPDLWRPDAADSQASCLVRPGQVLTFGGDLRGLTLVAGLSTG